MTHVHTTREGKSMLVTEMTDQHLKNTIALFERLHQKRMAPYLAEARDRGFAPRPSLPIRLFRALRSKIARKEKQVIVAYDIASFFDEHDHLF